MKPQKIASLSNPCKHDEIFEDYDEELLSHLVKTSFVNGGLTKRHKKEVIMKIKKMEVIMDTKKIFEETGKIGNEIGKLREKIEDLSANHDFIKKDVLSFIEFGSVEK